MVISGKKRKSFLGIQDLSVDEITHLLDFASEFKYNKFSGPNQNPSLTGKRIVNLFLEPSTRTRIAFEVATKSLGADIISIAEKSSSLTKGESLRDTASNIQALGADAIILRHSSPGSATYLSNQIDVPIINAGDGAHEHPSQALLDLYTMRTEISDQGKALDGMSIALVGDLRYGRAVHSLCKLLSLYSNIVLHLISPPELALPEQIRALLIDRGHTCKVFDDIEIGISGVDIVYVTRTQEERFPTQADADKYKGLFRLNQQIYTQNCAPNTVIMHPLPRDSRSEAQELDQDLNDNPNLAIFRQTDNGILIRMALFALVLGVETEVGSYAQPVTWFNAKRDDP